MQTKILNRNRRKKLYNLRFAKKIKIINGWNGIFSLTKYS